jgi:hypothetical protein
VVFFTRFSHNLVGTSSHTCYILSRLHWPLFDHLNNSWCGIQIQKIFLRQYCTLPSYPVTLRPKYLPQHCPILEHLQLMILLQCASLWFTPTQKNWQFIIMYILLFLFIYVLFIIFTLLYFILFYFFNYFLIKVHDKISCTEWGQGILDSNLLIIFSWLHFWFVRVITTYLNSSNLLRDLLYILMYWFFLYSFTTYKIILSFLTFYC